MLSRIKPLTVEDVQEVMDTNLTPLIYSPFNAVPIQAPTKAICTPMLFNNLFTETHKLSGNVGVDDTIPTWDSNTILSITFPCEIVYVYHEDGHPSISQSEVSGGAYSRFTIGKDYNGIVQVGMTVQTTDLMNNSQLACMTYEYAYEIANVDIYKYDCYVYSTIGINERNVGVSIVDGKLVVFVNNNNISYDSIKENDVIYLYFEIPFTVRDAAQARIGTFGEQIQQTLNNGEVNSLDVILNGIKNKATTKIHSTDSQQIGKVIPYNASYAQENTRVVRTETLTETGIMFVWYQIAPTRAADDNVLLTAVYEGGFSIPICSYDDASIISTHLGRHVYYTNRNGGDVYVIEYYNLNNISRQPEIFLSLTNDDYGTKVIDICGVGDFDDYVLICTDTKLILKGKYSSDITYKDLPELDADEEITCITYYISQDDNDLVCYVVLHTLRDYKHIVYGICIYSDGEFDYEWFGNYDLYDITTTTTTTPGGVGVLKPIKTFDDYVLQTYKVDCGTIADLILRNSFTTNQYTLFVREVDNFNMGYVDGPLPIEYDEQEDYWIRGYANTIHGIFVVVNTTLYRNDNDIMMYYEDLQTMTVVRELSNNCTQLTYNVIFDENNMYIIGDTIEVMCIGKNSPKLVRYRPYQYNTYAYLIASQTYFTRNPGGDIAFLGYANGYQHIISAGESAPDEITFYGGGALGCYHQHNLKGIINLHSNTSDYIEGTTELNIENVSCCIVDNTHLYYVKYNDSNDYNKLYVVNLETGDETIYTMFGIQSQQYNKYLLSVSHDPGVVRIYAIDYNTLYAYYSEISVVIDNTITMKLAGTVEDVIDVSLINYITDYDDASSDVAIQMYDNNVMKIMLGSTLMVDGEVALLTPIKIAIDLPESIENIVTIPPCINWLKRNRARDSLYFWVNGIGLYEYKSPFDASIEDTNPIAKCIYKDTYAVFRNQIMGQIADKTSATLLVALPDKYGVYALQNDYVPKI